MKPLQYIIDGTRLGNMVFPIPLGINFNLMYVTTLYNFETFVRNIALYSMIYKLNQTSGTLKIERNSAKLLEWSFNPIRKIRIKYFFAFNVRLPTCSKLREVTNNSYCLLCLLCPLSDFSSSIT